MKTLLGISIVTLLLSGCSTKHVNAPPQNTTALERQDAKAHFVLFNALDDDPDNPSPHNPLIKKFGDVPQVRTYIRFKQKLGSGTPLTVDEAIALYTADLYLYPYASTETILKSLKETKKRHEALGFPADTPVLRYTGSTSHDLRRGDNVTRTLPDGTRIISDSRLTDNPVVIPPREKRDKNPAAKEQDD